MITGATFQFKGEDIAKLNITGATEALQDKVAGVAEPTSASQLGAGASILVR